MKTRLFSFSLIGGAVAFVVAAWFATHSAFRLTTARRELASARSDVVERQLRVRPAAAQPPRALRPASEESQDSTRISDEFVARLESLKKTAKGRAPGGVPLIHPEDLFAYHAPLKVAYMEAVKGRQWVEYGAYFANARLNGGEVAQFKVIALDHERALLELRKTAEARGVPVEDPAIEQIRLEAKQAREAKLAALLGEARFQQFQTYEREIFSRTMLLGLNNLVGTTFHTDQPITVSQMNQLVALTSEFGMFAPAKSSGIPDAFEQLTLRSASILTPRQLEVFDLMMDYQQFSLARWKMNNPAGAKK